MRSSHIGPARRHLTRSCPHVRRGFTLPEMLVVIAVMCILMSILLPAIQAARRSAQLKVEQNRLRQIGVACQNFQDTYGSLPSTGRNQFGESRYDGGGRGEFRGVAALHGSGGGGDSSGLQCGDFVGPGTGIGPRSDGSAFSQLLPFLDLEPLSRQIRSSDCSVVADGYSKGIEVFQSPLSTAGETVFDPDSGLTFGTTAFAFNLGTNTYSSVYDFGSGDPPLNGAVGPSCRPTSLLRFPDGTSQTILAMTKYVDPDEDPCQHGNCGGWRVGEASFQASLIDTDTLRWGEFVEDSSGDVTDSNFAPDHVELLVVDLPPGFRARAFGGGNPQGGSALMADGSVRTIWYGIELLIIKRLFDRNDGETISSELF